MPPPSSGRAAKRGRDLAPEPRPSSPAAESPVPSGSPLTAERLDAILAELSHELRQPITVLRLSVGALRRQLDTAGPLDLPRTGQLVAVIDRQADRLAQLVTYLVEVARSGAGSLRLDIEEADLVALAQAVVESAQALTARHQIWVDAPPVGVRAVVDSARIEQVLRNLLDNAIKYSPAGGSIAVELGRPSPTTVTIAVSDHGAGIPPEDRPYIFDQFSRAHDPRAPGLGLGLYLCRRIVELHGGTLLAEFPAERGTRMVASLPCG